MMGGRDKVFAEAERAFFADDPQWAAELTTPLIRIDREDWKARFLKAAALRKIGYKQTSSSLRGFYLTGALEIEGKIDPAALQQKIADQLFLAETVPSETLLNMLRYRINPERALGKHLTLGLRFPDTGEDFSLTLRNSVLQIVAEPAPNADVHLEMTRTQFDQLFEGGLNEEQAVAQGASITGNRAVWVNCYRSWIVRKTCRSQTSRCARHRQADWTFNAHYGSKIARIGQCKIQPGIEIVILQIAKGYLE